ncbi:hypothetical protein DPMN_174829 [Dreissena polymorpha]|uniref:Uncharacterized protein n=1 Tax=Dreissena polymorpha TaxID=45954 RepID=A0A9D4II66_DREPO|nr:hypothetical protein DPMN_174829 [Dreissena polymorpha]
MAWFKGGLCRDLVANRDLVYYFHSLEVRVKRGCGGLVVQVWDHGKSALLPLCKMIHFNVINTDLLSHASPFQGELTHPEF